jgi:hypothetical protein
MWSTRMGGRVVVAVAAVVVAWTQLACPGRPRPELEKITSTGSADLRDFPDARAVILLDRTEVTFSTRPGTALAVAEVVHTRRVQVLKPEGRELARVLLPFDERKRFFSIQGRVRKADGSSVAMNEGAVIDVERYREGSAAARLYNGPGFRLAKVPDVQVGDIFEVTTLARLRDPRWLEPVVVGGDLPFVRGEVIINVPRDFDVDVRVTRQGQLTDIKPTRIPTTIKLLTEPGSADEDARGDRLAFVFDREPAIYPEGLAADPAALSTQVHVLLRSGPGAFRSIADVAAWYREVVGNTDQPDAAAKRTAKTFKGSRTAKVAAIQRLMQDEIEAVPTFENLAALRARLPADLLKYKVGDAKDQASTTLALLRAAGMDGFPVLVSRQGSFASIPDLPTPAPFNHVVVAVPAGGAYAWIDPSTPGLPTGRLPGNLQGAVGILVTPDGADLINLPEDKPTDNAIEARLLLELNPAGEVSGMLKGTLRGVEAARARAILAAADDQQPQAMRDLLLGGAMGDPDAPAGFEALDVFRVMPKAGDNKDEAVQVQVRLQARPFSPQSIVMEELGGRPWAFLWREGRRSPVFLSHKTTWVVRVDLKLPPGLGITELPVSVDKPGPIISLQERWSVADGVLSWQRTLKNEERIVPANRYGDLRQPVVAAWSRAQVPVRLVPGGDRGASYGGDAF